MYRDDEEAARARADALEGDLERAKDELESTRAKLAEVERERDELRRGEPAPAAPATPTKLVSPPRRSVDATVVVLFLAVAIAIVILYVHVNRGSDRDDTPPIAVPPSGDCTLVSDPPGADVVEIVDYGAISTGSDLPTSLVVGQTPFTQSNAEWELFRYELRATGYRTQDVDGCSDGAVVQLTPE